MIAFFQKLYNLSHRFVQIISIALTGILLFSAFLFTCYADDMGTQKVLTKMDNLFFSLLGMALFLAVGVGLWQLVKRNTSRYIPMLLFTIMGLYLIAGAVLIVFSKTVPAADAMSVYAIAEKLAIGDTSVIHPTGSYLSYYPHQIGLAAFFEGIIRFWNLLPFDVPAYHFIKCIYVVFACVIILFQYKTVHFLWNNEKADYIYLLLAGGNLPLLMYTSFVYGEIPSFTVLTIGCYYLFRLLKTPETTNDKLLVCSFQKPFFIYGLISLVSLTLSVMLRKNSLIFIIAVILVCVCHWLKSRQAFLLIFTIVCSVCCFSVLPAVQKGYELRAGTYLESGVSAISYLAMGMQESTRGNGWYNGFNFTTYQDTGLDTEATAVISKAAIAERLQYFKEHPGYAADFYFHKYLSQWADGTFACRQATLATFGGRREFFDSVYAGTYSYHVINYCNIYQNFLYLGAFLFCMVGLRSSFKKENALHHAELFVYLGLISALGGLIFHMFWEANSRYIFAFGLMLLPYAAYGLQSISDTLSAFCKRRLS